MLNNGPAMALFFTDYSLALVGLRDLAADPAETIDLSAQLRIRSASYRQHLLDWTGDQKNHLLESGKWRSGEMEREAKGGKN
jgi:hypothetical protein